MIEPYNAVGLVPTVWGIRNRDEIKKNIDHLASMANAAVIFIAVGVVDI